ncbi:MAG TPA: ABC transporter substrate-binding protein [Micromonosporaceae bacterium]|jgi:peptide/nickel transport system substrate-binding protein
MKRRPAIAALAAATAFALALTGCGSGTSSSSSGSTKAATPKFNAANGAIFNPSTKKGGTISYANSGDWDNLDPADTYYGYSWDFIRYYGRSLVMFKPAPGDASTQLVPDLATSLGVPSDNNKTWTYHIRPGLKYSDGTTITTKDIKYDVERSLDKTVFPNGPAYFNAFLDLQGYTSPYKDTSPDKLGLKAIETPDDNTIVFHLNQPFSEFDYFAMLPATIPVPPKADTGASYKEHIVSSGPYMFDSYVAGKSFSLKRNPNWDPKSDPNRPALPNNITVKLNVNAEDIDKQLLNGTLDVAVDATGVQSDTQAQIVNNPQLKARADLAPLARLWYTTIQSDVPPFDNIDCRKAVELAADHDGFLRGFGGTYGGVIATSLMPPILPGATKADPYNFMANKNGDVAAAKAELAKCGKPNGFTTNMSYRAERPKEKAEGQAIQASLAKVGITVNLKPYPQGDYFKLYAGKPAYVEANDLGLAAMGWGADWPDGFGYLSQIVDSRVIRASGGNTNLGVKDPKVDAMIDKALVTTDATARNQIWGQIDAQVMDDAYILPGVWASVLLYRPQNLTNVFISNSFGGYDYMALGVNSS